MKSLWFDIAVTSGTKIYGMTASFVALAMTARLLGPEGRGILVASLAWVGLFAAVFGLSLGQVTQYRIQMRRQEEWLPEMLGTLLLAALSLAVVGALVASCAYTFSDGIIFKGISPLLLGTAMLLLPLLIWDEYSTNLLTASGLLRVYNLTQIIGKSIMLIALIVLVFWAALGVFGALLAQLLGQAAIAGMGFYALWRQARSSVRFAIVELRPLISGSLKLHLNTVGTFLLGQATVLMLNQYGSSEETGWYQLAFQLVMIPLVIPQSASALFFQKMSVLGPDQFWLNQKKIGWQLLGIMLAIAGISYVLAPWLVPFVAGEQFMQSIKLFRLLLPVQLCMAFAIFMTNQWIGRGLFVLTTVITFIAGIGSLLLNFFLIPKFGAVGAAWSMLVTFVCVSLLTQLWCVNYCNKTSSVAIN